jgi:hypothetical protein
MSWEDAQREWEKWKDGKDILLSILDKRGEAFDTMREAGR